MTSEMATITSDDLRAMMQRAGVTYDGLKERVDASCCVSHAFDEDPGLDVLWVASRNHPDRFR